MNSTKRIPSLLACGAALLLAGCGGSGGSSSTLGTNTITTSGSNVQSVAVNAGPAGGYLNGIFTSVTVCTPSTTTCQTIDGVLVDIGSSGLRLLSSALTVPLTQQTASDGNPVAECLPFVSSYTWGPVQTADIQMSGESASSVPIQVINDTTYPTPAGCSEHGQAAETLNDLGANGILGVSSFAQDCGDACVTLGPSNPDLYYECPSSGCTPVAESLTAQVVNPVSMFASDNNGVIIELPAAANPAVSLSGSLVFGIGTESNNALGSASVYSLNSEGNFTTTFNGQSYDESFLDSGSNGLYFLTSSESGLPPCPDATFFYCPSGTQNFTATNQAATGSPSGSVSFSIANADSLLNDNPSDFVFVQLGGPNSLAGFDWGLPFFYGRNVFTAIEGKTTPGGTGPFWAY
jgi:hypothetical protein